MIRFQCTSCGNTYNVDDIHAGRKSKCPGCGYGMHVPEKFPKNQKALELEEDTQQIKATKKCPACAEDIALAAKKCKHCGEFLEKGTTITVPPPPPSPKKYPTIKSSHSPTKRRRDRATQRADVRDYTGALTYCHQCGQKVPKRAVMCVHCGVPIRNKRDGGDKSRVAYVCLAILLGGLGIHNFYAGYTGRGFAQLTLNIFGLVFYPHLLIILIIIRIWTIIEAIAITRDAQGNRFT